MQPPPRAAAFPLAAALLATLPLAACHHGEEPATHAGSREPVPVTLAPVEYRPLPQTISVTGTLYGDEEANISAEASGRVTEVLADVGDRVPPGARLAQIDPTDYRLEVEERAAALLETLSRLGLTELPDESFDLSTVPTVRRARAEAANAAAKRDRGRQLFEQDPPLMSEQEYQDLVTAYEVAQGDEAVALLEAQSLRAQVRVRQSELATAQQRLEDTAVRAPRRAGGPDGEPESYAVVRRTVSQGEYVSIGAPLYRLVVDHPLKYRAAVPERFIRQVQLDQPITLHLDDGTRGVVGRVHRITPAIDPTTRTFLVEALVDNTDRTLAAGGFARGTLRTGERAEVTHVPSDAVVSFAGLDKVYTVADGKAVEHAVTLLAREGELLPIEGSIGSGEVVVTGLNKLADGMPVTHEATPVAATP